MMSGPGSFEGSNDEDLHQEKKWMQESLFFFLLWCCWLSAYKELGQYLKEEPTFYSALAEWWVYDLEQGGDIHCTG